MTWIVPWNGREYDVDPNEMTGLEMSLIKQRTGLTYQQLVEGISNLDGDAIRSVFWIVDRRDDLELKFSEYPGPPLKFVLLHIHAFNNAVDELGKAMDAMSGSDGSLSSTDTPGPSMTP